jgi:hypothetical protein
VFAGDLNLLVNKMPMANTDMMERQTRNRAGAVTLA